MVEPVTRNRHGWVLCMEGAAIGGSQQLVDVVLGEVASVHRDLHKQVVFGIACVSRAACASADMPE